ncbi:MAG: hypothetical protein M1831_001315 [Alyxoria varia]|nr:MAG: hypothetical protein M1831_001315 [Alyxoria varia]
MAHSGTDRFPKFVSGDTVLVLSPKKEYQLHSNILRTHSSLFARMLIPENAAYLSTKARREGAIVTFRMELEMPLSGQEGVGHMKMRSLDDHGEPMFESPSLINPFIAGTIEPELHGHWDNLLRALYSEKPIFDEKNLNTVMKSIVGLIDVAEYCDSIKSISLIVDNTLVKQGQTLFRSMSERPIAWIDLMYRLKSELLFRETLIHLVGQWPQLSAPQGEIDTNEKELRDKLPYTWTLIPPIRIAATKLHEEEDERKRAIESRIMGHYPRTLMDPIEGGPAPAQQHNLGPGLVAKRNRGLVPTKRVYHSQNILHWLALNLFRHWFGQHLATDHARTSPDGGYKFYHHLAEGGESYLDHCAREEYLQHFPISKKSRTQFDAALNEIKEDLKPYVAELVKNNSMLDVRTTEVSYLTCAKPGKQHIPWLNEAEEIQGADGYSPPRGPYLEQDGSVMPSVEAVGGGTKKPGGGRSRRSEPVTAKKRTAEESHKGVGMSFTNKRSRLLDTKASGASAKSEPAQLTKSNLKKVDKSLANQQVATPTGPKMKGGFLIDRSSEDDEDDSSGDTELDEHGLWIKKMKAQKAAAGRKATGHATDDQEMGDVSGSSDEEEEDEEASEDVDEESDHSEEDDPVEDTAVGSSYDVPAQRKSTSAAPPQHDGSSDAKPAPRSYRKPARRAGFGSAATAIMRPKLTDFIGSDAAVSGRFEKAKAKDARAGGRHRPIEVKNDDDGSSSPVRSDGEEDEDMEGA